MSGKSEMASGNKCQGTGSNFDKTGETLLMGNENRHDF